MLTGARDGIDAALVPGCQLDEYEIAAELGISRQAVHVTLERALRKFRRKWEALYGRPEFAADSPTGLVPVHHGKGNDR